MRQQQQQLIELMMLVVLLCGSKLVLKRAAETREHLLAAEFSAGEVATQVAEQTARTNSCAAQSGQLAKNQQDLVELLRLIKSSHHDEVEKIKASTSECQKHLESNKARNKIIEADLRKVRTAMDKKAAAAARDALHADALEVLAQLSGEDANPSHFGHLTNSDLRNTLIVKIAERTQKNVGELQALTFGGIVRQAKALLKEDADEECEHGEMADPELIAVLREMQEEGGESFDGQSLCRDAVRNSVIIELHSRTNAAVPGLQSLDDHALAARSTALLRDGALPLG